MAVQPWFQRLAGPAQLAGFAIKLLRIGQNGFFRIQGDALPRSPHGICRQQGGQPAVLEIRAAHQPIRLALQGGVVRHGGQPLLNILPQPLFSRHGLAQNLHQALVVMLQPGMVEMATMECRQGQTHTLIRPIRGPGAALAHRRRRPHPIALIPLQLKPELSALQGSQPELPLPIKGLPLLPGQGCDAEHGVNPGPTTKLAGQAGTDTAIALPEGLGHREGRRLQV